jgi:hypothetical protein
MTMAGSWDPADPVLDEVVGIARDPVGEKIFGSTVDEALPLALACDRSLAARRSAG